MLPTSLFSAQPQEPAEQQELLPLVTPASVAAMASRTEKISSSPKSGPGSSSTDPVRVVPFGGFDWRRARSGRLVGLRLAADGPWRVPC